MLSLKLLFTGNFHPRKVPYLHYTRKTYIQAAKDTWALLHSHGVEAIINDNLISNVLSFGALIGGVVCAIIGALVGLAIANDTWTTCTAIGFIVCNLE
jgi:hypothetical protein